MSTYFVEVYNSIQPKNRAQKEVLAISVYNQHVIITEKEKDSFIESIKTFVNEVNSRNPRCGDVQVSHTKCSEGESLYIEQNLCIVTFKAILGTAKWNQEKIDKLIRKI